MIDTMENVGPTEPGTCSFDPAKVLPASVSGLLARDGRHKEGAWQGWRRDCSACSVIRKRMIVGKPWAMSEQHTLDWGSCFSGTSALSSTRPDNVNNRQ